MFRIIGTIILILGIYNCNLPALDRLPLELSALRLLNTLFGSENGEFTLGGEARNLLGSGLRLNLQANNASTGQNVQEDLVVSGTGTTQFAFQARLPKNSTYTVTITQQPLNPTQICEIAGGTGTATANVESILVQCGESLDVAQPVFTPTPGSFPSAVGVTITSTTLGSSLFYTTDGSDPNCSGVGTAYAGPVNVPQPSLAGVEIRAIACFDGRSSNLQVGNYIVTNGQIVQPLSSLLSGTYTTAQNTTLAPGVGSPAGTTVHYTTDGTTPTCSSPSTPNPVSVANSLTLRAISCAPDWTPSVVTDYNYTISGTVATPVPGTASGSYNNDINLTFTTTTPGASIRYTMNQGADPLTPDCTVGTTLYTGSILINENDTRVRAIGCLAGWTDSIPTPIQTYNLTVANATLSPSSTTIQTSQTITGTTATTGATIHFAIGATPNCGSPSTPPSLVAPSFQTENTSTVQAIACKANYTPSAPVSANYILTGVLNPPDFSPATGTYTVAQTVTMSKDLNNPTGATIHYTTDGTDPTCASPTYSTAINVATSTEIRAIACRTTPLWTTSSVASANYTITGTVADPSFGANPPGTYNNTVSLTLTSPTPSSTVYWFTNQGSAPANPDCSGSNGNTGPITIDKDNIHVAAIACRAGWTDSAVVTGIYRLIAAVPTPDIVPGTYGEGQTITFSTTTTGASILINSGTIMSPPATPTCPGTPSPSITLPSGSGAVLLSVVSCRTDFQPSTAFSQVYTIGTPMALPVVTVDTSKFVTVGPISGTRCYTTNGVDPLCSGTNGGTADPIGNFCAAGSTPYTALFQLLTTTDLRVRNCSTGNLQSPVAQQNVTVLGTVGAVSITPAGGTVNNAPSITMTSANSTAIYYRTDGTNPDCTGTGSTLYSGPFTLTPTSPTMTINAIGCATDWIPSGITTETYNFFVATPTISLAAGTYNDVQTGVTLSTTTTGAGLYYTVDGTTPNCVAGGSTFAYSGPLTLPTDSNFLSLNGNFGTNFVIRGCKANYNTASLTAPAYTFQVAPVQILFGDTVFLSEGATTRSANTGPVSVRGITSTPSATICKNDAAGVNCSTTGACVAPSTSLGSGVTASEPGFTQFFKACRQGFAPSGEKSIVLTIPDRNTTLRIFVSAQTTLGNTSTMDADNLCNTDPNRPYQGPEAFYQAMRLGGGRTLTSNWVLEPGITYQSNEGRAIGLTPPTADGFNDNPTFGLTNPINPTGSGDVWTGITVNGAAPPRLTPSSIDCSDWTSTAVNGGIGNSSLTNSQFVNTTQASCSLSKRLYCVERDYRKRIFITDTFTPGNFGGAAGADSICNGDANKPPTGHYKALIGVTGVRDWNGGTPIDWPLRPNTTYYQLDRTTPIFSTDASSMFPLPLQNTFRPSPPGIFIWTGFSDVNYQAVSASNCMNWTSSGTFQYGTKGRENEINILSLSDSSNHTCSNNNHLICVEQ